jgi:hypothetical protein
MRKAFPPLKLDDPVKSQSARECAHTPRHHPDFRRRQPANGWLVKVIEMGVREQDQIDGRQVLDFESGSANAFQQKKPVRKIRIDQHIQVGKLDQERGMADPRKGHLAFGQFGKHRLFVLSGAFGQQNLPNHLAEKRSRIKMLARRQNLE